ncbi:MAG: hypothetical protein GY835_24625 [bacterium]|nr:hypothetical protein [bacterium]
MNLLYGDANTWLFTRSGGGFRPFAPAAAQVELDDIAWHLAGRKRFGGATRPLYTVAQHCVEVSYRVPAEDALWGLLHDSAEAWLSDVPAPIKRFVYFFAQVAGSDGPQICSFEAIEATMLAAVAERFGLELPIPDSVAEADLRMRATEIRDLVPVDLLADPPPDDFPPYPEILEPQPEGATARMFIARFKAITAGKFPRLREEGQEEVES